MCVCVKAVKVAQITPLADLVARAWPAVALPKVTTHTSQRLLQPIEPFSKGPWPSDHSKDPTAWSSVPSGGP
jgi:hypothetical protein